MQKQRDTIRRESRKRADALMRRYRDLLNARGDRLDIREALLDPDNSLRTNKET